MMKTINFSKSFRDEYNCYQNNSGEHDKWLLSKRDCGSSLQYFDRTSTTIYTYFTCADVQF